MSTPTEQAADPQTPASALALLAASPDPPVRRLVAANPATPADTLRKLALGFPDEVLDNPALPLHLLDDPSFFEKIDVRSCQALLKSPRATPELCQQLAQHPNDSVRITVAHSSLTSVELLEQMAFSSSPYVVSALTINPRLPLATLHALLLSPHEQVLFAILHGGRVGDEWRALLADNPHPALRASLAARSKDAAVLTHLSRDPAIAVRLAVARNVLTPGAVIRRMRRDQSEELRKEVVKHPSTSRATLLTLLRDTARSPRHAARVRLRALWQTA